MPRYTGVVVFESLIPFHTTFSSRLASRFLRWKAHMVKYVIEQYKSGLASPDFCSRPVYILQHIGYLYY